MRLLMNINRMRETKKKKNIKKQKHKPKKHDK